MVLLVLLILSGCPNARKQEPKRLPLLKQRGQAKSEIRRKGSVPTLFVHGYKGTVNSFKGMIDRLEGESKGQQEVTLTVDTTGTFQSARGVIKRSNQSNDPSAFEDNENNEWNQAEWIRACLVYLRTTDQINKVNIVGHSMVESGGLRYLVTYGQETTFTAS